ncbi:efflux RND transporter permease subunit [Ectothiorhodospiraceae bacterium BW-2]|nr:efflux RND transporter permease subunit [Ectothiorhodospiraceae bacterium BW-2]
MIQWLAYHPTAANLMMVAIMGLGLLSLPEQQRETFPTIKNDKVEIRTLYPGATTDEVEDAICRRIENRLDSITLLDETRCEAREGIAITTAIMVEEGDMSRFLDDVKAEIDAITDFPDEVELPTIQELGRTDQVMSLAITGPSDPVVLKSYAEDLKQRLLAETDIATVTINGFAAEQIVIELSAATLRQYGLSAADIAALVQGRSLSTPTGQLKGVDEDAIIRVDDQRRTVSELQDLTVISGVHGAAIRLGDIATLRHEFANTEERIEFNGKRAAMLSITKTRDQDTLNSFDSIAAFIAQERQNQPPGLELTITQDVSSIVRDRLSMLVRNGIQGLAAVFLMLWLFFGTRYSFWVTLGLPVSFLGALAILPHLGVTINMISMVGLLIGIGLLMDDAIVISENIAARLHRGERALQAAVAGATQVLPSVLSSFTTTILIFGSLAFISGEIGQVLRVMPIVLLVVLSVSLLEAFLILPNHLGHSLAHMDKHQQPYIQRKVEQGFNALRDRWFGPLLDLAIDYRYLTVGLVVMSLLLSIALPVGGWLKFKGFPNIDGDIIEARLLLPQGTPLAQTEQLVKQITTAATRSGEHFQAAQPEGQSLIRNISVIYGQNPDAFESGPHVARIVVDLLSTSERGTTMDQFRDHWAAEVDHLTDVIALKFAEPTMGPGGKALDLRIIGPDLEQLKEASHQLQQWLNSYAGVINLSDDLRPGKREYRIRLKPDAGVLGLNASQLASQLRTAFQGIEIDQYPNGSSTIEIELQLNAADRESITDLEQFTVTGPKGVLIPLTVVADIEEVRGWARIHRINGQRAITIQGDVQHGVANAQELLALAQQQIIPQIKQQFPHIQIDIQGESNESAKTSRSMLGHILTGLFGVYILLAIQFRGYLLPVVVMAIMPAALIGTLVGHWVLGLDMTMPSIIGLASLFGVVVNNSILLVIFMREAHTQGESVIDAAKQAGRARFRPIVLTSMTTIGGLTPLLLETSLQAQVVIPLAASLAFGLTSATLTALFTVPALYTILHDFNLSQPHSQD